MLEQQFERYWNGSIGPMNRESNGSISVDGEQRTIHE